MTAVASVFKDATGWVWALDGAIQADSYPTATAAVEDLLDHVREQEIDLCVACGDQGVCPECVGT